MNNFGSVLANNTSRPSTSSALEQEEEDEGDSPVEPSPPRRYNEPFQGSDVILHVDNQTFHCHATILNLNSPVWCDLFKENPGEERELQLVGKEPEAFNLFLDLMYPFAPQRGNTTQEGKGLFVNYYHFMRISMDRRYGN